MTTTRILGVLAALVLIVYTGVLFELRADTDASTPSPSGPTAGDVSAAWRARWADLASSTNGGLRDVGCEAKAGTSAFSCHVFLSSDGTHGARLTALVSPTSSCTGSTCMVVDDQLFRVGTPKDSGDVSLESLFAGLD